MNNSASDRLTHEGHFLEFLEAMDLVIEEYTYELHQLPYGSPEAAGWSINDLDLARDCIEWIEVALFAKENYKDTQHEGFYMIKEVLQNCHLDPMKEIITCLGTHDYSSLAV